MVPVSLNDLDWSLTQISRSRYYSTSNNSKIVQDRAILFYNGGLIESRMCSIERRRFQWLEQPLTRFSRSRYSLTLNISYGNSYYGRRIGNRTQAFEWYLLEWHPVTFSIMIIQREITWKWYNILQYLQWPTNRKSFMIYRTSPFSMTLNDPYKLTPFFDAEYLRNGTTYTDIVSLKY